MVFRHASYTRPLGTILGRMKKLVIILALILSIDSYCQTYGEKLLSDKDVFSFVQWEVLNSPKFPEDRKIRQKRLLRNLRSWRAAFPFNNVEATDTISFEHTFSWFIKKDTIFSEADKEFMAEQFMNNTIGSWPKSFKGVTLVDKFKLKTYHMTVPLFSKDRNLVLIHKYFYCGSLCARACTYVYRKINNNEWKLVTKYKCWMS